MSYMFFKKLTLLASLLLMAGNSFSFSLSPMYLDMAPVGTQARKTVTVTNSSPKALPVVARVAELQMDVNGKTSSKSNISDFMIFPPQAIISPHSKQTFRVQWRSQPRLAKSKIYELTIAQVPAKDNRQVNTDKKATLSIQIGIAFASIINMRASSGASIPAVTSSRLSKNKLGKSVIETVISNRGNQNFLLASAESKVSILGINKKPIWVKTYTGDDMRRVFGLGLVQPNKTRRMRIPLSNLPDHIARQAQSIKLEIRPSAR